MRSRLTYYELSPNSEHVETDPLQFRNDHEYGGCLVRQPALASGGVVDGLPTDTCPQWMRSRVA